MKKRTKSFISLLLVIMMSLTTLVISPIDALAVTAVNEQGVATLSLWADPQGRVKTDVMVTATDGKSQVSALGLVQAHTITSSYSSSSDSNYFMFLPTTAELDALMLYFDNGTSTTADITTPSGTNVTITNGEASNVFDGYGSAYTASSTWIITLSGSSYNFHVVKSDQVGTVYLNTSSGSMSYVNSSSDHTAADTGLIQVYQKNGIQDYSGELAKITGHGNGTWNTDNAKNSYNIKLASSTSLCGMAKAKKWILLAGGVDMTETQIKNRVTYDFASYVGVNYQPEIQPVDLYCNGHYMGSYELVEKPEIKSNRVDVTDSYENLQIANGTVDESTGIVTPADFDTMPNLTIRNIDSSNSTVTSTSGTFYYSVGSRRYAAIASSGGSLGTSTTYENLNDPDDITGGYIFGIEVSDRWTSDNIGFCAYSRQCWTLRSADYASRHMVDYCYDLLYAMGSAIYQSDGNVPSGTTKTGGGGSGLGAILTKGYETSNPAPSATYQGMHWSDILDANSAVTYYWTQEFFKNMDASTTSTYFYKDSDSIDSKVYAGPVWDSDNTMASSGSRYGVDYGTPQGWYVNSQKIYKFYAGTNNTSNSTLYNASPYSFYAALSKQSDFNEMKNDMWYQKVSPAVNILLGNKADEGRLHSIHWYASEMKDSGEMNNIRLDGASATYNVDSVTSLLTNWISSRQTWINGEINTEDINSATVSPIANQSFTGSPITPAMSLTYQNSTLGIQDLSEGTDYTVSYSNNTNVGTATATITGIGRFVGTSKTITFSIVKNDITDGRLSIYDAAYIGDTVEPTLLDKNAVQIISGVNYTWYADGTQVGTGNSYIVKDSDAGKVLTAVASGDNTSTTGTLTSGGCPIASTVRPSGTAKNIATFSWKYGDDGTSLQGGKNKGYSATSGIQKDTANIHASVDGTNYASLDWSGTDTFTRTDGTSGQQPVMEPSSEMLWNEYPYFDINFSTIDYSDVTFTADIGATSKGAAYYSLQYSTDGTNFTYFDDPTGDFDGLTYEFTAIDKKTMKTAFDVTLPEECENKENVIIRIIVPYEYSLDGNDGLFTTTNSSGKIAINNVVINGVKENDVTGLDAPTIETVSTTLYTDDTVTITEINEGADIKYTLTDANNVVSDTYTYDNAFAPFKLVTSPTVTVTAWCEYDIYKSDTVTATYSYLGDAIAQFNYKTYSDEIVNGKLPSNGGTFDKSTVMTAVADGKTQFVPMYATDNKAFVIAPDDGAKWSTNSGFYFETSTAGYKDVKFYCEAYTTASGPKSTAMQYSLDGITWTSFRKNTDLPANSVLETYCDSVLLPAECYNQKKVYIRLVTTENLTNAGSTLWDNASKGNLYINNVTISGTSDGTYKMPYTNKPTNYFGLTGTIKYYSADGIAMQYNVTNGNGQIVMSGTYPQAGIQLSTATGFSQNVYEPYTVNIWAGDDDDQSLVNSRTYYYKGDDIATFNMSSSKFDTNISEDFTTLTSTTGSSTLSLYPNSTDATTLSYTDSYGVKASWSTANPFVATKSLNNPNGNGYWLIKTSTKDFTHVTMSLDQISSNKGPRDWGIAYSTDGAIYTYVANSNSRAISNDASASPVQTYSNLVLPQECWNQDTLYIKVFINGGEAVDTTELELVTKGNIGINDIELCGITTPKTYTATVKTTVLENPSDKTGAFALDGVNIIVNDSNVGVTGTDGTLTFDVLSGHTYTVKFDNGLFSRTATITGGENIYLEFPLVAVDINGDGIVTARDYAKIHKIENVDKRALLESIYMNFLNTNADTFSYTD